MVVVIDPQIAGISGDMLLCSLVDLGAHEKKILEGVKIAEKFLTHTIIKNIEFQKITKHGIDSTSLILDIEENIHERKGSEIKQAVVNSINTLNLSPKAKTFAESCIDTLISSESKIHGTSIDSVHFHEASSIDTLVDILGVAIAADDLGLFEEEIICMPISVGNGSVTFSHGVMSNPASAVLEILKNSELFVQGTDTRTEMTTPTGACMLVNLATSSSKFYPLMKITSVGYGAGKKDFDSFSNVLKIVRGNLYNFTMDTIKILETNVDDVSGEILGNLIEQLLNNGAKDVSIYSGITKKCRPTNLISVMCDENAINDILNVLISETGTLGIRISNSERFIVPRQIHSINVYLNNQSFSINYKTFSFNNKIDFKIEFDDLKQVSNILGKPIREVESLIRNEIYKLNGYDIKA